ncbi:MAG: hypothetical protein JNL83_25370 [Myxococcales bacterium]|nr:hypothetical protein [Myxococcales bacterium]
MWARLHKIDKVRPQPNGGAIVIIEDERTAGNMQRVPSLSTLVAIARVLSGFRVLDAKFGGKGEVRYATWANVPSSLSEAITRAGGSIATGDGQTIRVPAYRASVEATIDVAFSELASSVRGVLGISELDKALEKLEAQRRAAAPIDKDAQPEKYWTAVLELAALAGEQARRKNGRWIDTKDMPLPFALKFPEGVLSHPTRVAEKIVSGTEAAPPGAAPPAAEPAAASTAERDPAPVVPAGAKPPEAKSPETKSPDLPPVDEKAVDDALAAMKASQGMAGDAEALDEAPAHGEPIEEPPPPEEPKPE